MIERRYLAIVGLGTLGTPLADLVSREILGGRWQQDAILICDPDEVATHNVAKSALYTPADVGRPKVDVVRERIAAATPTARIVALPTPVEEVGLGLFRHVSVVFVAVDRLSAKMHSSRMAWAAGVPLIVGGELAPESVDSRLRWFRPQPYSGSCLECGWGSEYQHLESPYRCTPPNDRPGPATFLTAAYRTAASMVEEAHRLLALGDQADQCGELRLYPEERRYLSLKPRPNPAECLFDHAILDPVVEVAKGVEELTIGEIFAAAGALLPDLDHLELRQPVASGFTCASSHCWPGLARPGVGSAIHCPTCGDSGLPRDLLYRLDRSTADAHAREPLSHLVASGDILTFANVAGEMVHLALALPAEWVGTREEDRVARPLELG